MRTFIVTIGVLLALAYFVSQLLFTAPRPVDAAAMYAQYLDADDFCMLNSDQHGENGLIQIRVSTATQTRRIQLQLHTDGHSWLFAPNWAVMVAEQVDDDGWRCMPEIIHQVDESAFQSLLRILNLPTGPVEPALIPV